MINRTIILYICLIIECITGLYLFQKKNGKISVTNGFIFFAGIGYGTAHIILRLIGIE